MFPPYTGLCRILGGLRRQATQSILTTNYTVILLRILQLIPPLIISNIIYTRLNIYTVISIINSQSRQFLITHFIQSTAHCERPKLTVSPRATARPRHYRGAELQQHAITKTMTSATAAHNYNLVNPRHYNPQVQTYKRADRYTTPPPPSTNVLQPRNDRPNPQLLTGKSSCNEAT